jgi:hypothetical protein
MGKRKMGLRALSSQPVITAHGDRFSRQAFTLAEAPAAEEPKTAQQCGQILGKLHGDLKQYDQDHVQTNSLTNIYFSLARSAKDAGIPITVKIPDKENFLTNSRKSSEQLQELKGQYAHFQVECSEHIPSLQENSEKNKQFNDVDKRLGQSPPAQPAPIRALPAAAPAGGAGFNLGKAILGTWNFFRAITSPGLA